MYITVRLRIEIKKVLWIVGLSDCLTNQEQYFDVDLSHAGHGRLSANIDGPVDTDVQITAETDGYCRATYVPTVNGSYRVTIKVDDKHVTGEWMISMLLLSTNVNWCDGFYATIKMSFSY